MVVSRVLDDDDDDPSVVTVAVLSPDRDKDSAAAAEEEGDGDGTTSVIWSVRLNDVKTTCARKQKREEEQTGSTDRRRERE